MDQLQANLEALRNEFDSLLILPRQQLAHFSPRYSMCFVEFLDSFELVNKAMNDIEFNWPNQQPCKACIHLTGCTKEK